ncbi:MAG: oligosaccharide flippase family protein [Thermohalobaculum sp.]|nr:oligosaccharide flippase family protein [Thermohalobaculum sp.]
MSASLWRSAGFGVGQCLRLASSLIMTRLLVPEDFGLMAVVFTVHTGLAMLTDLGIRPAITRSTHGEDPRYLRTAWTVQIVQRGVILCGLLGVALALHLAARTFDFGDSVYGRPELPALLAFSGIVMVAAGLQTANTALAERRMALPAVIATELAAQAVTIVAMIAIALVWPSVWALAIGGAVGAVVQTALGHLIIPGPRMALCWDRRHVAEIWHFGKWLMASSLFGFIAGNGDRLIFGALFSAETFGLYAIAMVWIGAAAAAAGQITGPVTLPALSEVRRERPHDLARVLRRLRRAQDVLFIGSGLALLLGGPALIATLYPAAYAGAGAFVSLLAVSIALMRLRPLSVLLLAGGESRAVTLVSFIACVSLLTLVPAAALCLGDRWAVFLVAINAIWSVPVLVRLAARHVPLSPRSETAQTILIVAVFSMLTVLAGT